MELPYRLRLILDLRAGLVVTQYAVEWYDEMGDRLTCSVVPWHPGIDAHVALDMALAAGEDSAPAPRLPGF